MKYLLTSIIVFTSFSIMSDPREMIMGLKKMDRDGNRAISFKEYSHKPQKLFQHMDSDSDGVLTYSEFSTNKLRPPKRNKNDYFSFLDINDDQKVSKEEFVSKANKQPRPKRMPKSNERGDQRVVSEKIFLKVVSEKIFLKLDINQDGALDEKELSVAKEIAPKVAKDHAFQKLNTDGNENITREEFLARPRETFSRMDSDSNGAIERNEIREFMKNNKKKFKKQGKPFIMQKDRKHDR